MTIPGALNIYSLGLVFRELLTGSTAKLIFDFNPPLVMLSKLIDEMTPEPFNRPETYQISERLEN